MKIIILLTIIFSSSLSKEILDVSSLNIENLEFALDENFVRDFLTKYEDDDDAAITAVVNEFADKIFHNIEVLAVENNLDPLGLQDVKDHFLASSITLTNGKLNGISTIDRSDDIVVSYKSGEKTLDLYIPIIFSNLNFTYDYHVVVLLIGPKGSIVGKVKNFKMNLGLQFDFNTYHASIQQLKTTNKGHVSLTFHGNAVVDVVVNILSEFVTLILQPLIGHKIEGVVSDIAKLVVNAVNDAIDSVLFPGGSTTVAAFL